MKLAYAASEQQPRAPQWDWASFQAVMAHIVKSNNTQHGIRMMFRILDRRCKGRISWQDWMSVVDKHTRLDSRRASDAFRVLLRGSEALTSVEFVDLMLEDPSASLDFAQ
jgi:Ca2+-binding EF-hand superfamily protein